MSKNDEKMIFGIGFDLATGVDEVIKQWEGKESKRLQKVLDKKPLKISLEIKKNFITELRDFVRVTREVANAQRQINKAKKEELDIAAKAATVKTREANQRAANVRAAVQEATQQDQINKKKADAAYSEERLAQAKKNGISVTHAQNAAYKTQSGYLQRLVKRMVAYASVTQAFSFIRNIREVTAQFELQRVALGSIIGDLNEANAMFEQIKAAAVKSPFQIKELVTYTKQLAAYNIKSDELFETTQRLADISAGLGVGMERLVLAYGQIRATGYLRASEVRQLTEAGIPIVEELAKKMSDLRGETVSAAEVMGMISERAISFGMVKEVFDNMTSAGGMFYKMQEKQSETLAGQWSNLQDAISIMYEEIGNTEGVNNSIKRTIGLVKFLAENWRVVGDVTIWSVGVAMGYAKVIKPISELVKKHRLLNEAKEAEIKAEKNLARIRQLNAEKAEYLAQDEWVNDAWLEATNAQIKAHQEYADKHTKIAVEARKSATSLKGFGGALKSIGSFIKANLVGMLITAITAVVSGLISARQEANRLNKELAKIDTEGALQADQSARNFERLAKAIRESADGSEKQTTALAELRRSYGDLLPSQDKEIKALVQEKSNYDALIGSIRKKIELQIQEQKLNTIASEYGSRFTKWEGKIKKESIFGSLSTQEIDIFISEIKKSVDEGLIATTNDAETNGLELRRILEGIVGNAYGSLSNTYFANIKSIRKLIETQEEYNKSIDSVGGALDRLDGEGKNLSDTFNTWQKELSSITEGKNLKGEGIRLFDDESISQINKLTDATARVAEEYDKLAKEKKEVDKALKSEGAKADKGTYAKLQERLGKINEGMSGLYGFLKKYGALDLIKSDDKTQKSAEQALKDELSAVEKIYKRYQDLRKLKSETDTQSILAKEFKGVNLTTLSKAYSPEQMLEVYEKALAEAQRLGKKDLVLEIQTKIGEFNIAEEQRKLEKSLKDLSDKISRTKTAKEFFDRMLGMTGDKQLSASLTVSIYGGEMGDDLGERLAKDMATKFQEQVQTYFGDIDISSAINKATGEIDPVKLEKLLTKENIEKMGEDNVIEVRKIINDLIKANADYATELFKSYEKFFDYEKRMTMVTQREEEERKKIRESMIPDDQKTQLEAASKKREQEQISAIEIEQLKDTADWEKTFEDLNNLGSLTVKNLISLLEDYIAKKKKAGEPIAESDMKILMNELNQLRERDAQLDPFATIKASLKDLTDATKEYNKAKKDGDEKGMADAQNKRAKALNKLETAVNAVASGVQNLSNLLTEFQELLGIEDDSVMGEVFNGAAKALGFVATALSTAIALTLLWNSTLWANPLFAGVAIVSGVLGAIAGVFSAIANAKVSKADREIEALEDRLDSLSYAYNRLQKAQEKAFGGDYIRNYEQRLANLQAQQEAYLKQADKERSKGKKADTEKIKEYEKQARDTADAIKDMQGELSAHFLGTDLTSAARDFANAWIDAYKEFGSTTDAMKAKFQDMIQNMIVESFAARVIATALEDVFEEIDRSMADGMFDMSEAAKVTDMTNQAIGNIDVGMTNLMNALSQAGISVRGMGSELTGISRDIATASEESILGLAAGINTQNFYISQVPPKLDTIIALLQSGGVQVGGGVNMQDLITIQNQHLSYLPTIAQHTAETVAKCEAIVVETRRTADALERVIKPRGTQATYTMNTL